VSVPEVPPSSSPPPNGSSNVPPGSSLGGGSPALVGTLVTQFLEAAQKTKNPSDFSNYRIAGRALWRYGTLPTTDFDAYLLLQIQEGFANAGYARTHCNKLVNFCIHIFKWGEVRRLWCSQEEYIELCVKKGQVVSVEELQNDREENKGRMNWAEDLIHDDYRWGIDQCNRVLRKES